LNVAALGAGVRAGVASVGLYFNVEYAYGFSNLAALDKSDRANVTATLRF
jgi:hypothetical protein